jgi:hypothetical protein
MGVLRQIRRPFGRRATLRESLLEVAPDPGID